MPPETFQLPIMVDLLATFVFGLTGALVGIRRGYDIVGVFALALICAVGGSVIRDGIFLQQGPPAVAQDARYLYAIGASILVGFVVGTRVERFGRFIALLDAIGLSAYAVFGTQKALLAGLEPAVAVLIGVINAVGGGLLRDILTREEPLVFRPGQFYVLAAALGATVFVVLAFQPWFTAMVSGLIGAGCALVVRVLSIVFNLQTRTFYAPRPTGSAPPPVA
jgi:uncharacterized membrane protein YeiH